MKSIINFYLFMFIAISCWSQREIQNLEVTYVKAYKNYKDSSDTAPIPMKNLEYKLICNRNESRFELIPFLELDHDGSDKRINSKGGGNGVFYKNIKEELKLHQFETFVDGKLYLVKPSFKEYNWVITEESKTIGGYLCYKAYHEDSYKAPDQTGKMKTYQIKIIVWFTPEINFPFGPAGFDGLPGLVLEKSLGSFYFIASKIQFNQEVNIVRPKDGIKKSKQEYLEMLRENYKKLINEGK
ncbi:GLPGLI family protein [Gaetbulibacter sp. M240]|uniref:GLPGLI family protein n=1 Tax=Gaetbulibacter sp. M240 TaxID=3126511 RepID=UPI00374EE059